MAWRETSKCKARSSTRCVPVKKAVLTQAFGINETAADVDEAFRTEAASEDFATGGCIGDAAAAVPSIWDAPRRFSAELDSISRNASDAPIMQEGRAAYNECAQRYGIKASGPDEADQIVIEGGAEAAAAGRVVAECASIWRSAYRRAETTFAQRFVERNSAALDELADSYRDTTDAIHADAEFLEHLTQEALRAASTINVADATESHEHGD